MIDRSSISNIDEFERSESAVRCYCRDMPSVFVRAINARVWDEDGHEYIDFLSGCGSLNYGHNNPAIKAKIVEYLGQDGILNGLDLHTVAKREFLTEFREVILEPRGLNYRIQFTGPSGTNSVEAALKLARKVTGRQTVVAFTNAFHGMSLGSLSVTARAQSRISAGVELSNVIRLPFDGYRGAGKAELDRYEAMVTDPSGGLDAPAAFILETIQGEGGLNCASGEWIQHLAALAKRLGALLIVDDVQAGCGRSGDFFSFEPLDITPDLVCLAKSIGGVGLPMALLLIKPEYDVWEPGEHNGTFRGNSLAFVAGRAALQYWREPDFARHIYFCGQRIGDWIAELANELGVGVLEARGRGLMRGVRFPNVATAGRVAQEAFARHLLIETSGPYGEVLKLLPPCTIEPDVLDLGLSRLRLAAHAALGNGKLRPAA